MKLPRLYAIVDAELCCRGVAEEQCMATLVRVAKELHAGGARLIQYRNKKGGAAEILRHARELRRALPQATLIMNDRADLAVAAGFNGVHLGQDDLTTEGARKLCHSPLWIGRSTHRTEQVRMEASSDSDYIAIGPVFSTTSKQRPEPVVGLEGVRAARSLTAKPLVAIGGITRANCREVLEAGADAVAVISDLLDSPRKSTEDFLRILM